ncbi:MAG: hypothetical protein V3R81_08790, partial [Gammaproteobacteria bacterium]
AINGLRLRGVDVSGMLDRAEPGDAIRLTLTRGDELLEREAVLQAPRFNDCSLTLVENTDQASLERRTGWLGADLVT